MKKDMSLLMQRSLSGFAAGVMVAASFWSLLLPAFEQSQHMGRLAFIPAAVGFLAGVLFLLLLDRVIPHMHALSGEREGPDSKLMRTTMLVLAVTLHNIPEGMAVGAVFAGAAAGSGNVTFAAAAALSVGIAVQNFPEGAIISMPLSAEGIKKSKSFLWGALSGAVEPVGAALTVLLAGLLMPVLPYFLSFAAGAMIYVVIEELIPEMAQGKHSNAGAVSFALGFAAMMILDSAFSA